MANFNMQVTDRGRALQAKAQAGTPLVFTRMRIGSGSLSGQQIADMTGLVDAKMWLTINKSQATGVGKHTVGASLNNSAVTTGFYFRELGVFASDPNLGEILYCYGNAGSGAEYIPASGGSSVVEKQIDVITLIGNATNVSAELDKSLVSPSRKEFEDHQTAAELDHPDGSVTTVKLADGSATDDKIGERTLSDTTAPTTSNKGKLTTLLGWLAYMIKSITGKTSWRTAPATSLEAAKEHMDNKTVHVTAEKQAAWDAKPDKDGTLQTNLNVEMLNGTRRYNGLSELGITLGSETIAGIFSAMKDLSEFHMSIGSGANMAQYPIDFGNFKIYRYNSVRGYAEFHYNGIASGVQIWDGIINQQQGWGGWKKRAHLDSPRFTGNVYTNDSITVSHSTHRFMGQRNTIANSRHQKLEIEIPFQWWMGTIDISIGGNWNNLNVTGLLTKRIAPIVSGGTSLVGQESKYIEKIGGIGENFAISNLSYNSTKKKFIVHISMIGLSAGIESILVYLSGQNTFGDSSAIQSATMTQFYADTAVYPKPAISIDSVELKGIPTAPTAAATVSNTQISSTQHVTDKLNARVPMKIFNSVTTPVGASSGDLWFPPSSSGKRFDGTTWQNIT